MSISRGTQQQQHKEIAKELCILRLQMRSHYTLTLFIYIHVINETPLRTHNRVTGMPES